MSLAFTATGYEHANRGGASRLFGVGQEDRYNVIRRATLADLSFDGVMSSLEVSPSSPGVATVALFSNDIFGLVPLRDFEGHFVEVGVPQGSGGEFHNLADVGFGDRTHSLLVINTQRQGEFRVSFRDRFLDQWNSSLDAQLGGDASRKGDPLMTWKAFPEGVSFLSSDQMYLEISQSLNINIDWWPDYDASITYHLFLFLDDSNHLQGFTQRWAAWVEGGVKSDDVMDKLWPKVVDGVAVLNQSLTDSFAGLPEFNDFYYLPGRQIDPSEGIATGMTWDDVTLVFEL